MSPLHTYTNTAWNRRAGPRAEAQVTSTLSCTLCPVKRQGRQTQPTLTGRLLGAVAIWKLLVLFSAPISTTVVRQVKHRALYPAC